MTIQQHTHTPHNTFNTFSKLAFTLFTLIAYTSVAYGARALTVEDDSKFTLKFLTDSISQQQDTGSVVFKDRRNHRWKVIIPSEIARLIDPETNTKFPEYPLLKLHEAPILLDSTNTGEGHFFSHLPETADDGDFARIAYKLHIPNLCLARGADLKKAEVYLVHHIPLTLRSGYTTDVPVPEVEENYRKSLCRFAIRLTQQAPSSRAKIKDLQAAHRAELAAKDEELLGLRQLAKHDFQRGLIIGGVSILITYHFFKLLLTIMGYTLEGLKEASHG